MGNVTNMQADPSDGVTYQGFQTTLNGTDHVFLTMIKGVGTSQGFSYSKRVEITPKQHGKNITFTNSCN
jgi:hypothetical protein